MAGLTEPSQWRGVGGKKGGKGRGEGRRGKGAEGRGKGGEGGGKGKGRGGEGKGGGYCICYPSAGSTTPQSPHPRVHSHP